MLNLKLVLVMTVSVMASSPVFAAGADPPAPPEPKFRHQTIDDKIQIGYGVAAADVDGDKRIDILVADKTQFAWYRNPTWEKFVIAENLTKRDNVCLAAQDLDGDGRCELAVGCDWAPNDRETSGAVFYMIAPEDRTQKWEAVKLHAEPTVHRMRWVQLRTGPARWGLAVLPLHGRGTDGAAGSRFMLYHRPQDPRAAWKTELLDESMHLTHNFDVVAPGKLLLGGREGVRGIAQADDGSWQGESLLPASLPADFHGVGELRGSFLTDARTPALATVEPMHGNRVVVWIGDRAQVLTEGMSEGHALAFDDLLRIGSRQIVAGWRGKGGRIVMFTCVDLQREPRAWRESVLDDGGMACEDLCLADLDGDGDVEIIASGRATKNVKIYWNETPAAASTKPSDPP